MVIGLGALAGSVAVVGFVLVLYRIWRNPQWPESTPGISTFHATATNQLIKAEEISNCPLLTISYKDDGSLILEVLLHVATNVRLVKLQSQHYEIASDILAYLKPSKPKALRILCISKQTRNPADASEFFLDLLPRHPGSEEPDWREKLANAVQVATEQRVSPTLEIAYSDHAGLRHFRCRFKAHWRYFGDKVDIEPIETVSDSEPPPTAPDLG